MPGQTSTPESAMMPARTRDLAVSSYDATTNEFDIVFSTGAQVRCYDWRRDRYYLEELSLDPAHVDLSRLNSGAPLLDSHARGRLEDQIGVVIDGSATVDGSEGRARCRLSARDSVAGIRQDMQDGILRNISIGYSIQTFLITEPAQGSNELPVYRAIAWQPFEVTLLPVAADAGAGVRSAGGADGSQPMHECSFIINQAPAAGAANSQERSMPGATTETAAPTNAPINQPDQEQIRAQAIADERQRALDIRSAVRVANLENGDAVADGMVTRGLTIDAARSEIFNLMAQRSQQTEVRSNAHIQVIGDNTELHRGFMAEAIAHRLSPNAQLSDGAREYRYLNLREMAVRSLEMQGINTRNLTPLEVATRALHTTSDFPLILANVMNKRLRADYEAAQPTYRQWARRAPNAPDFKQMQITQLGASPELKRLAEGADIDFGTVGEGAEKYSVVTYARGIRLSRQMLINDDLRAFDRVATGFSASAARLENRLVYGQLIDNPMMADNKRLFHADHNNLAASGAAIGIDSLKAGRAAIRKQTGLQKEKLNLAPAFLLAGSDNEQAAYQFTSNAYVPASVADINEFRAGGRTSLEPIIDSVLDEATAWFLLANNSSIDTVEYCFLDGSEGVYLDSATDFDSDGMKVKARLDFAAKAIDFRGTYKNPGVAPQ